MIKWGILADGIVDERFADGLKIAGTGMTIVFAALVIIAVFIVFLPRILAIIPEGQTHGHAATPAPKTSSDDTAVIAALGFVLHREVLERKRDG